MLKKIVSVLAVNFVHLQWEWKRLIAFNSFIISIIKFPTAKTEGQKISPLEKLRGSVVKYSSPTTPISEDDWEFS